MAARTPPSRRLMPALVVAAVGLVALLAVLLDLGPFGDGDGAPEGFVAAADEACADAHDRFLELQEDPPTTPAEAAALTDGLIQISEDELDVLRGLEPPEQDRADFERYLRAREDGIALLREGLQAARDEDAFAYADAQAQIAAGQARRAELAQAVGLHECSRPLVSASQLEEDAQAPSSVEDPSGESP